MFKKWNQPNNKNDQEIMSKTYKNNKEQQPPHKTSVLKMDPQILNNNCSSNEPKNQTRKMIWAGGKADLIRPGERAERGPRGSLINISPRPIKKNSLTTL